LDRLADIGRGVRHGPATAALETGRAGMAGRSIHAGILVKGTQQGIVEVNVAAQFIEIRFHGIILSRVELFLLLL
jgi:hypothetical protein